MLDYTELPADGVRFEQLVREILVRSGFEVHWTGVGPDGGRDLVATEKVGGLFAPFSRKWLVSCKHKAHGGASVGVEDISDIVDACAAVDATGFLLACSTQPSSSVVRRLEELERSGNLLTLFWDGIEIERRLDVPDLFPLCHRFFPVSTGANPWRIYGTATPSLWAANYNDYFLYLSSRVAHSFPPLSLVERIAERLRSAKLPGEDWTRHLLRLRAVYFDNKHEHFTIYVDYLHPGNAASAPMSRKELDQLLQNGRGLHQEIEGESYQAHWDVLYLEESMASERFHEDAKQYYEPYMRDFQVGSSRKRQIRSETRAGATGPFRW